MSCGPNLKKLFSPEYLRALRIISIRLDITTNRSNLFQLLLQYPSNPNAISLRIVSTTKILVKTGLNYSIQYE
jgi:hypothetical protein